VLLAVYELLIRKQLVATPNKAQDCIECNRHLGNCNARQNIYHMALGFVAFFSLVCVVTMFLDQIIHWIVNFKRWAKEQFLIRVMLREVQVPVVSPDDSVRVLYVVAKDGPYKVTDAWLVKELSLRRERTELCLHRFWNMLAPCSCHRLGFLQNCSQLENKQPEEAEQKKHLEQLPESSTSRSPRVEPAVSFESIGTSMRFADQD